MGCALSAIGFTALWLYGFTALRLYGGSFELSVGLVKSMCRIAVRGWAVEAVPPYGRGLAGWAGGR
jgi:hypothetical protein